MNDEAGRVEVTNSPPLVASLKPHYLALDGLRGVAILLVFFFHYGDLSQSSSAFLRFVGLVKGGGWMGVDLFFVLSGFLITGILIDTCAKPNFFRKFYIRRALRLFPVFYGVAALLLMLTPVFALQWRPSQAWYLFNGANFVQLYDFSVSQIGPFKLMHLWSLALEEQFYMVWPLVVFLVRDRSKLLMITIGITIIAPLLRIVLLQFDVSGLAIYYQLPTRMDGFGVGAGLALLLRKSDTASLAVPCRAILAGGVLMLVGLVLLRGTLKFTDPWMIAIGYTTLAFMFASILVLALQTGGFVHSVLTLRVLRFYGVISYGFYVYHELIHDLTKPLFTFYVAHLRSTWAAGLLYLFSVLMSVTLLSYLSYRFFEAPFLRLKPKFE